MKTRIGTVISEDYTITKVIEANPELGVAVGFQDWTGGTKKWCTWEYIPARDDDNYFWGHYMIPTESEAIRDALQRIGWGVPDQDPEPDQVPEPEEDDDTSLIGDYQESLRKRKLELWEDLSEGLISEEEWELQMWADGFLPDDHFSDDDNPPF